MSGTGWWMDLIRLLKYKPSSHRYPDNVDSGLDIVHSCPFTYLALTTQQDTVSYTFSLIGNTLYTIGKGKNLEKKQKGCFLQYTEAAPSMIRMIRNYTMPCYGYNPSFLKERSAVHQLKGNVVSTPTHSLWICQTITCCVHTSFNLS